MWSCQHMHNEKEQSRTTTEAATCLASPSRTVVCSFFKHTTCCLCATQLLLAIRVRGYTSQRSSCPPTGGLESGGKDERWAGRSFFKGGLAKTLRHCATLANHVHNDTVTTIDASGLIEEERASLAYCAQRGLMYRHHKINRMTFWKESSYSEKLKDTGNDLRHSLSGTNVTYQ